MPTFILGVACLMTLFGWWSPSLSDIVLGAVVFGWFEGRALMKDRDQKMKQYVNQCFQELRELHAMDLCNMEKQMKKFCNMQAYYEELVENLNSRPPSGLP